MASFFSVSSHLIRNVVHKINVYTYTYNIYVYIAYLSYSSLDRY